MIMLPSWFTKLRDVKVASKLSRQQEKQHESPPRSSKKREAPSSFAKSLSLRRASSKARNTHFDTEIRDVCRNQDSACCSLSSHESNLHNDIQNSHVLQSAGLHEDATRRLLMHHCRNQDGCNARASSYAEAALKDLNSQHIDHVQEVANSKSNTMPKLVSGEGKEASTEKGCIVIDLGTEDFSLTSETSSTYGSERSSSNSSAGSKCSASEEEGYQGGEVWQEGFRKPGSNCRCEKDGVGSLGELWEEPNSGRGCVEMLSRSTEEAVEVQKQSVVFDQLQRGKRCSLCSSSSSSAFSSSDVDEGHQDEEPVILLDNLTSKPQVADREMSLKLDGETEVKAIAKSSQFFIIGDEHRTSTSDKPDLAMDESFLQEEGNSTQCIVGSPEMTVRSTRCSQHTSFSGNFSGKCSSVQMQRTRQRRSSISAAMPPDLQGVVGDSLAFVTISDDPYEDFRQSMYEMIMEKDLEGSTDVEELLYCYLTLNSPKHHELIEEVFSDVWSAILMTMR